MKAKLRTPKPVMLSANVFYLEHVRTMQMDDRVVYLTQDGGLEEKYKRFLSAE